MGFKLSRTPALIAEVLWDLTYRGRRRSLQDASSLRFGEAPKGGFKFKKKKKNSTWVSLGVPVEILNHDAMFK